MAASYPSSIFAFTTVNNGDTSDASQIDNPVNEIIAVETGLLNGFQHNLIPDTDTGRSLGTISRRWVVQSPVIKGLVDASDVTAGQVKFPAVQNASANVNTFDDYKEGTWTPVLGGVGGTSGQTYATQIGNYTKIGREVVCDFQLALSAKGTITGSLQISGLPFALGTNDNGSVQITYWGSLALAVVYLGGLVSGSVALIYGAAAAGTTLSALDTTFVSNTTDLRGRISYKAAT